MSTIASLAIKLTADTTNFLQGVQNTIQTAEKLGASMIKHNTVVRAVSGAWRAADNAAHGYLGTAAKAGAVAGGIALAIKSIKNAASSNAGAQLASSFKAVREALDSAGEAFASTFIRVGKVNETAAQLRNVINNLRPAFVAAGAVAGIFFRTFTTFMPLIVGSVLVFKALAAVIAGALHVAMFALHAIITRLIVQGVTWVVLGKAMTPLSLAVAAAKLVWAGAMWALDAALAAGVPLLGAVAAAAIPIVAGLALVVGSVYAVYRAWQYLSAGDPAADQAASVSKLANATEEATKSAMDLINALREEAIVVGLTEAEKKARDFAAVLDKANEKIKEAGGVLDRGALEAQFAAATKALEAAKKRAEVTATIADLEKQAAQAGMSDAQKLIAQMRALGATDREKQLALSLQEQAQSRERSLDLAKQIFDIEQAAARAGMSEMEQRLAGLRDAGATELQIAAIRARMEGAETAQRAAQTRLDIEKRIAELHNEAAFAALSAAEKELALARQRGATEEQIARLKGALDSANLAGKAAAVIEATKSDAERLAEKTAELQQLLSKGLITSEVFDRAMKQAQQIADRANKKPDSPSGGSGTAAQGGAIFKGSQQDIAARFRQPGDTNRGVEQNTAKTNVLLEKLVNRGERASSTVEVVDLN